MNKTIDFSKYKFRCSMLPILMTKSKKEGELSKTVQTVLNEIYLQETYGIKKIIVSKYMEKGINKENESISLYRKFTQEFYEKNEERFENEYLTGIPDIITKNDVKDIKTCWDIFTFFAKDQIEAEKDYYWQLFGYMWLLNKKSSLLIYSLLSNEEYEIYSELKKIIYMKNWSDTADTQLIEQTEAQLRVNNNYDNLSIEERLKIYKFDFNEGDIEKVKNQLNLCREHLQKLYLQRNPKINKTKQSYFTN